MRVLSEAPAVRDPEGREPRRSGFVADYKMKSGEICKFDLNLAVGEAFNDVNPRFAMHGPVVGRIRVGKIWGGRENFYLIDTRPLYPDSPPSLLLVDDSYDGVNDPRRSPNFIDLHAGVRVNIGRHPTQASGDIFDHTDYMARQAFALVYDGDATVTIINGSPTNPTRVTGQVRGSNDEYTYIDSRLIASRLILSKGEGGYTDNAQLAHADERVDLESAPHGYLKDTPYPIIGHNSPTVLGGVYLTEYYPTNYAEAILVDNWSPELQEAQEQIVRTVAKLYGKARDVTIRDILTEVRDATRRNMVYDKKAVEHLRKTQFGSDGIIPLSEFIKQRIGVCRHQNLYAAVQMEALIQAGYLIGTSAVERRKDINHAWATFYERDINLPEFAWVVDPASRINFLGTKEENVRLGFNYSLQSD